ncbi:hypothetical protein HYALB_00005893 [Hymenoscyphus albidus]|uniref:Uncharacterized protein n=1 Tax=Hymenoscyphus albidus TaxID=595503 RepID=A0A9N9LTJ8_9HELO|nr:hypothetical protein HYALB_00005893 [Hymenoscyphus albidus]
MTITEVPKPFRQSKFSPWQLGRVVGSKICRFKNQLSSKQPIATTNSSKAKFKGPEMRLAAKNVGRGEGEGSSTTIGKTVQTQTPTPLDSSQNQLSSLPPDSRDPKIDFGQYHRLFQQYMHWDEHVNPCIYILMATRMYGRITGGSAFRAQMCKLIRTLEPHLSIAQERQLKRKGIYGGLEERDPDSVDQKAKPNCATCVQGMKNMDNLQVVEMSVHTKSIGESLASLKNLKALSLFGIVAN